MSGCDLRGAEALRIAAHDAELDLTVAKYVWVRRAALAVLVQEVGEHLLAVLTREVYSVQRHAELEAHLARVVEVARAVAVAVVFPVAHVQALHGVPRVPQQQCGDSGIHAARERNDG